MTNSIPNGPYYELFRPARMFKEPPKVLHQRTCPECGRTLVNLYRRETDMQWVCLRCKDKEVRDGE